VASAKLSPRTATIARGGTADATVPIGRQVITIWMTVDGATNTVQTTRAEFSLTVTQ
jgi:hypothetical protein